MGTHAVAMREGKGPLLHELWVLLWWRAKNFPRDIKCFRRIVGRESGTEKRAKGKSLQGNKSQASFPGYIALYAELSCSHSQVVRTKKRKIFFKPRLTFSPSVLDTAVGPGRTCTPPCAPPAAKSRSESRRGGRS